MKKLLPVLLSLLVVFSFACFALGSGEDDSKKPRKQRVRQKQQLKRIRNWVTTLLKY